MTKKNNNKSSEYALEGQEIKRVQKLKHLGITYQENNKINLDERLKMGRQTIYALLGSGLHAKSGMSTYLLPHHPIKFVKHDVVVDCIKSLFGI
jgi:hypothetical protein